MQHEVVADDRSKRRKRRLEQIIVVGFSLVVSIPFCNKAFHIDDPLYLNIAQQILIDPLRPYDGTINWQQIQEPAWNVSISPPGYSYWLAIWMAVGVTTESGLHAVGSIWLVILGLATHAWACRLGDWPLAITLFVLSSPIAIAGQNLMLDVPMLALAASAMVVYLRANETGSVWLALVAGLLAGLSVNVKYAGVVVIGVMAVDAVLWRRWPMLVASFVGIALLVIGQMTVASKGGTPQLFFARQWITDRWPSDMSDMFHRGSASLMYLGSSGSWFLLLGHRLLRGNGWSLTSLVIAGGVSVLAVLDLRSRETSGSFVAIAQAALFSWNGALIVAWTALQLVRAAAGTGWQRWIHPWTERWHGNSLRYAVMLGLWTLGFWYLGTLNGPFVAPRAILPYALSLGLATLFVVSSTEPAGRGAIWCSVATTLLFGLLVGFADYRWASIYRAHAPRLMEKYRTGRGAFYFLGHWGWQHYASEAGMVQFDPARMRFNAGDIVVWPRNVDCPLPVPLLLKGSQEIGRESVAAADWLPRTRSQEGLVFLHGDTDRGRIPWGWVSRASPEEVFFIFRYGE